MRKSSACRAFTCVRHGRLEQPAALVLVCWSAGAGAGPRWIQPSPFEWCTVHEDDSPCPTARQPLPEKSAQCAQNALKLGPEDRPSGLVRCSSAPSLLMLQGTAPPSLLMLQGTTPPSLLMLQGTAPPSLLILQGTGPCAVHHGSQFVPAHLHTDLLQLRGTGFARAGHAPQRQPTREEVLAKLARLKRACHTDSVFGTDVRLGSLKLRAPRPCNLR